MEWEAERPRWLVNAKRSEHGCQKANETDRRRGETIAPAQLRQWRRDEAGRRATVAPDALLFRARRPGRGAAASRARVQDRKRRISARWPAAADHLRRIALRAHPASILAATAGNGEGDGPQHHRDVRVLELSRTAAWSLRFSHRQSRPRGVHPHRSAGRTLGDLAPGAIRLRRMGLWRLAILFVEKPRGSGPEQRPPLPALRGATCARWRSRCVRCW